MALFQHSILKKYVGELDKALLEAAWERFQHHFHNAIIQQNILHAKEEEYQEGFVRDLFVSVLGYTLKPQPDYNLVLEQKSTSDATKSDGAILSPEGNVIAVIELKDTTTADLGKVERQAFGYKHQHKDCRYIITSNFQQLRFYINDAIDHEAFDLFTLDKASFTLLYCCLQQKALQSDVPLRMKQQSVAAEENVTKKLYDDYSRFKKQLFENITQQNQQYDPLLLFKKTQKLLDRFLFILFAEDRGLLPSNSVREILSQWEQLKELDNYVPLYERFKKYFGYLDTGYKGKHYEIFAYNGGLFAPDEILDNITIDDALLFESCKGLSNYDFESEIDVNILGHIFEHSLNEIEAIEQQLGAGEIINEKKTSKRKKDGVFYTPRYITKYIVENTVGALCIQKRNELNIVDEDFAPQKRKANTEQLLQKLESYRAWLLQLTICDPACGSGAFLNQALEFLITEHQNIDTLKAKLFGDAIMLSDVENSILENNLYGVDINEEATDIAKLSLWLRTARKGRKLNTLNNRIKCGNSLIDDVDIAGDKAFNWQQEFPEVFEKGGFDVVIGNPPWGAKLNAEISTFLVNRYPLVPTKLKDTYMYFMLLSLNLIKTKGYFGCIVPNTWLLINNTSDFRRYFLHLDIQQIIDHGDDVFADAIVESSTIILKNENKEGGKVFAAKYRDGREIIKHEIDKKIWLEDELHRIVLELKEDKYSIIKKMELVSDPFEKSSKIIFGIKPYQVGHGIPAQTQEMVDRRIYHSDKKLNDEWHPLVTGTDTTRYSLTFSGNEYIHYGKWLMYSSNQEKIESEKILLRRTSHDLKAVIDNESFYPQNSLFIITSSYNLKYLLCLLNSKLFDLIYKAKCPQVGKVFAEVKPSIIKSLPIANVNEEQQLPFIVKADIMLSKNKELQAAKKQFLQFLQNKFEGITFSKKLQDWPSLSFNQFVKELEKQKIKLSVSAQAEWMPYFEPQKAKANAIQQLIDKTDKEIDEMVYQLYGLTEEERRVVEESA